MKFRAILRGVEGLERSLQTFGPAAHMLMGWAEWALREHPKGRVEIHELREVLAVAYELREGKMVEATIRAPQAPQELLLSLTEAGQPCVACGHPQGMHGITPHDTRCVFATCVCPKFEAKA